MEKKKILSIIFIATMMLSLLSACSSSEDEYAIEDELQSEWNLSNSQSAIGAVDCNVFSVKVDKVEGNIVFVSYSLKSVYASGDKKFVKLKGAKLMKVGEGKYKVIDTGY